MAGIATEARDQLGVDERVDERADDNEGRKAAPTRRRSALPPRRRRTREAVDKRLVKVSFNLPADELEALKELAEQRQTSATQVVREALRTERYIQELVDNGATLIAKIGRRGREIVFSHMA
jgi:hypothetical protein